MRRYIRYRLRIAAQKAGVKPSKHVHFAWDEIQTRKVGSTVRQINQAKGTKPKRLWKSRILAVMG
jgi:hypothetical protein